MPKPNVLFILVDDLGWGDVHYHGSEIRTPNIDRLAQSGVELDQHYVCPVCTPTRVSFMTGKHPGRFGKHATCPTNSPVMKEGTSTIATIFKKSGYETGLFGKWHLGSDVKYFPGEYGFDECYGSLAGGVDPYSHRYKRGEFSYSWHRNGKLLSENGHATDLITNEAISWIQSRGKPWFAYIPYTAVHTPIKAPEDWVNQYSEQTYDKCSIRDHSFKVYAGYTSHMDHNVGRLIEALKESEQLENTLVIFTSDNGAVTYDPSKDTALYPGHQEDMPRTGSNGELRGHKAQIYEGGIRTPAAVSWPGTLSSSKVCEPIQMVDWLPTLAKLIGSKEHDDSWDGQDIFKILQGKASSPVDRIFYWNLNHNWFGIRKNGWKLIFKEDVNSTELFHINKDPLEKIDLAREHPEIVEDLMLCLANERKRDDSEKRDDV